MTWIRTRTGDVRVFAGTMPEACTLAVDGYVDRAGGSVRLVASLGALQCLELAAALVEHARVAIGMQERQGVGPTFDAF